MPLSRSISSGRQHGPLMEDPFEAASTLQHQTSRRSSRSSSASSDPKANDINMNSKRIIIPPKETNNMHVNNKNGTNNNMKNKNMIENRSRVTCAVPTGCLESIPDIRPEKLGSAVRVICNNELCTQGNYMHKDCFEGWESTVLTYLKSCGRARSWSEKQRLQNLWTKKGWVNGLINALSFCFLYLYLSFYFVYQSMFIPRNEVHLTHVLLWLVNKLCLWTRMLFETCDASSSQDNNSKTNLFDSCFVYDNVFSRDIVSTGIPCLFALHDTCNPSILGFPCKMHSSLAIWVPVKMDHWVMETCNPFQESILSLTLLHHLPPLNHYTIGSIGSIDAWNM